MNECFICGLSGEKTKLFDAIVKEGIVRVCARCSLEEDIPVIKNPTVFQIKEAERKQEVSRRISRVSGSGTHENKEISLKEIVDRDYSQRHKLDRKPRPDLIDNFHWLIMRARRAKKVTQEQLARDIAEPLTAIKLSEQGVLPEDYRLINKLESYLGIQIIRKDVKVELKRTKILDVPEKFDYLTSQNLTISDLQELKKQKEFLAKAGEEVEVISGEDISGDEVEKEIEKPKRSLRELIFGSKKE